MIVPFAIASAISAALFTVGTLASEHSGLFGVGHVFLLLFVGVQLSLLVIVLIALPMLAVLLHFRLVNLWVTLISGLMLGMGAAASTEWPQTGVEAFTSGWADPAVRRLYGFGAIGVIAALSFWLTWKKRPKRTPSD